MSSKKYLDTESLVAVSDYIDIKLSNLDSGPGWWYFSYSLSRTVGSNGTLSGSYLPSLLKIGVDAKAGGKIQSSVFVEVNIKVGDFIFTSLGEIGVITSVPSVGASSSTSISYVTRWVSNVAWTCLEEGTLITMSDGSKKEIQELKQGDLVLGYDFENNKTCETICLGSIETFSTEFKNFYIFDNGKVLSTSEHHTIYDCATMNPIDVRNCVVGMKTLDINKEEVSLLAQHLNIISKNKSKYYQFITSNNTYFANEILNANYPADKLVWIREAMHQEIPEEIMEIFLEDSKETFGFEYIGTQEFLDDSLESLKEIRKRQAIVDKNKKFLEDTDYVAIKKSEGCQVDESIIEQRESAREEINQVEQEMNEIYCQHGPRYLRQRS